MTTLDQAKRSRDNIMNDNKRKKLEGRRHPIFLMISYSFFLLGTTASLLITYFEDLSNEVIYEIFESLDFYDVYIAFSNLNQRFENLINSILTINIDLSSISKSKFQYYYKQIIIPNQLRIHLIRLTNLFIYREFISLQTKTILTELKTLIIHNIRLEYLEKFLIYLRILPKLSSLSLEPLDEISNSTNIYRQLFCLPVLKHCQLFFNLKQNAHLFPIFINTYSPIEHLVIKNSIRFDQLERLLSFVSNLRYLTCLNVFQINDKQNYIQPTLLPKLTHFSLKMRHTTFEQFKRWIKNLIHRIEVLHISTKYDFAYLDADQWKELITNNLPHLRIFDIQHTYAVHKNNPNRISDTEFNSEFWRKRQWFFEHLHGWKNNWDNRIFQSINPYRYYCN
jgi:hypothetical protein